MIKNARSGLTLLVLMAAAACDAGASTVPSPYQGVVELDQRTLAFEVGGRVVAMNVARGQAVKKGQVIATLDDTLALSARAARAAELDAAKAQLALLESGARPEDVKALEAQVRALTASEKTAATLLARQRDLTAQKVAPEASLDELSGRVKATRAQREAAEHQLASMRSGARTPELDAARARVTAATVALAAEDQKIEKLTLRAPIDGTILEALSDLGEVVGPGTPVATLGDVNHPYVDVFVATKDIAPLGVGQAGHILIDGVETLKARVEHIADTTEFTPRYVFSARERPHLVVRVRLRVEDPAHHVHAGLPAFATFEGMPVAVQP